MLPEMRDFFFWASAEGAKGRDRGAAEGQKEEKESEWTQKLMQSEWWGERARGKPALQRLG